MPPNPPQPQPIAAPAHALTTILARIAAASAAAGRTTPARLLAVSKTRSAGEVAALAALGQQAFGENYVQEAQAKRAALEQACLDWHLIGHLQSNKCRDAARTFDCIQTIDRLKLLAPLAEGRPADRAPLDLLVQVNIDDETTKSGCTPADVAALADAIAERPRLRLRGLMAIPAPHSDPALRRQAFERMRALFERLQAAHPQIDTLSMGMSDDFELAVACGATLVRVGTALFGSRDSGSGIQDPQPR